MEKIYYEVFKDMGERDGTMTVMRCDTFQDAQDYKAKAKSESLYQHPLNIDKWRIVEGADPELLGEGDPQPRCTCDICWKELYDGDKAYGTTGGSVLNSCCGFVPDSWEPWNTVACVPCGERISEKICALYQKPATSEPGEHSEGKLEPGGESALAPGCVTIYANGVALPAPGEAVAFRTVVYDIPQRQTELFEVNAPFGKRLWDEPL